MENNKQGVEATSQRNGASHQTTIVGLIQTLTLSICFLAKLLPLLKELGWLQWGQLVVGVSNAIGLVPRPFSDAARNCNHSQKIHEDCNGEGFTASGRVCVAPHLDKLNDDKNKIASHIAGMVDMVEGLSVLTIILT